MHLDAATGEHVGPQRLDELPGGHLERRGNADEGVHVHHLPAGLVGADVR
jgi:hypothetical protein